MDSQRQDSPARLDAAKQLCKEHGAEMTAFYMTAGSHEMVAILDALGDEAVAKIALALGSGGHIRTETLKAFSEAEYRQLVQTVG